MYLPNNVEVVNWFAKKVFHGILPSVPDADLWSIGCNPPKGIRRLGMLLNIQITGDVPNRYRQISEACVVGFARFHAAGVKAKILVAIGLRKLVVAASHAIIETSLDSGQYVLMADHPEILATSCAKALQESAEFKDLKSRAINFCEIYHTMDDVVMEFISELPCFNSKDNENLHAEN